MIVLRSQPAWYCHQVMKQSPLDSVKEPQGCGGLWPWGAPVRSPVITHLVVCPCDALCTLYRREPVIARVRPRMDLRVRGGATIGTDARTFRYTEDRLEGTSIIGDGQPTILPAHCFRITVFPRNDSHPLATACESGRLS